MSTQKFDVAIIGSGIAGSTLAAILAKHGKSVLVFEANEHPRFAIGESMILETSEMMRAIAELYNVPEIAYFSSENYRRKAGSSHGVKRHFGFWHHEAGAWHQPSHTLQAVIPKEPHGHEFHLYRQDCDYFMLMCAIKNGATVLQKTAVWSVDFGQTGVTLSDLNGDTYEAEFVVDGAGFRSILANKFDLRVHDQQTNSRAIFTHMINVDSVPSEPNDLPFSMDEGTLHHVFDGGWLWVIPFNNFAGATNPVVSVGLMLDPEKFPSDGSISAETEFYKIIEQFPSIHAQLASATSIRGWVRTPRIQFGSKQTVGDRWALLGHAAGFIDPLYSKGLYISMASVFVLAHLLLSADAYTRANFLPLETMTKNFLRQNDRLVANSYRSWGNYSLWQSLSVVWLLGAYTELVKLNSIRAQAQGDRQAYFDELISLELHGGGYQEYFELAECVDSLLDGLDLNDRFATARVNSTIRAMLKNIEWMPNPFLAILDGAVALPRNKIRPDVFLRKGGGFLGRGAYRKHFFGDHSLLQLGKVFVSEKVRYHPLAIRMD